MPQPLFAILMFFTLVFFSGGGSFVLGQETEALPPLETLEVANDYTAGASLESIQGFLNSIKTMRANFIQIAADGSMAKGTMHMERPGKIRFEYTEDNPLLIVSDGAIVNLIDYEIGQITKWPVSETPLALLLQEDIVLGDNVELATIPTETGPVTMVSTYDPDKPEQGTLTLYFTGSGKSGDSPLLLDSWEVVDAKGSLTRVVLSGSEINIPLDDDLWKFDDPRNKRFERRRRR
ncbi:MAG: outer membrane lipoprotein carrier protein LolA [Proteobacteria bacterium]|nr:outer membrane lipoprotein carrier protein LolA [Pseudomonadota bacterium]